jgi:hypothetical protein
MFLTKKQVISDLFTSTVITDHTLRTFNDTHNIHDMCKLYVPFRSSVYVSTSDTIAVVGGDSDPDVSDYDMVIRTKSDKPCDLRLMSYESALELIHSRDNMDDTEHILLVNTTKETYVHNVVLFCYLH